MTRIIGIAGSLRKASFNAALLRAAAELIPTGTEVEIASIAAIPLYDGDLESERGIPDAVTALKDRFAGADGLLLVTPEYNNSLPGVFKNAIDWLTRPASDIPRVFGDKPVALIGATPGMGGTRLSQSAWLPVLRTLGTRAWSGKQLYVSGAAKVFDDIAHTMTQLIQGIEQLEGRLDYWWISQDPVGEQQELVQTIVRHSRHPVICGTNASNTKSGALVHIAADTETGARETAAMVDAILKGTPVGSIPVHSPAKIDFGVNLTTAVQAGIPIPSDLLELATKQLFR